MTCIRLDATAVAARSDKELAEANFKGVRAPSAARGLRQHERAAGLDAAAGPNTAADHLRLQREAVLALLPALRRRLMATCGGAGASHELVKELDRLGSRHGYQLTWSVCWALGEREKAALAEVPATGWVSHLRNR